MRQRLKHRTGSIAAHLAAAALALAGCGENEPNRVAQYQFILTAAASETTVEGVRTHDCLVIGLFDLTRPVPPTGVVRFPVQMHRQLWVSTGKHGETTTADTTIGEAVLDYTGLGQDTLRVTFGAGPYTATLGPGGFLSGEYSGEWTCGPEVPLAQDSTLLAYGYDAELQLVGTWRLSELIPIQ